MESTLLKAFYLLRVGVGELVHLTFSRPENLLSK